MKKSNLNKMANANDSSIDGLLEEIFDERKVRFMGSGVSPMDLDEGQLEELLLVIDDNQREFIVDATDEIKGLLRTVLESRGYAFFRMSDAIEFLTYASIPYEILYEDEAPKI